MAVVVPKTFLAKEIGDRELKEGPAGLQRFMQQYRSSCATWVIGRENFRTKHQEYRDTQTTEISMACDQQPNAELLAGRYIAMTPMKGIPSLF